MALNLRTMRRCEVLVSHGEVQGSEIVASVGTVTDNGWQRELPASHFRYDGLHAEYEKLPWGNPLKAPHTYHTGDGVDLRSSGLHSA